MDVTLPEDTPEFFIGVTRLEFPVADSDRSLVVTWFLVETALPLSLEPFSAEPREVLNSVARDWAGISLLRPVLPAFEAADALLTAAAAEPSPILDDPAWEALRAARDVREILEMSSGSPALKLLLTVSGTLLTMVVSTRLLEKSVALTTVIPLLLLLFMITVVLLITVFGRFPYPQALGLHPT
jgi:hypothetical protein